MIKEKTYYNCPEYYLLVYPTLEKATLAANDPGWYPEVASRAASDYWSNQLNCKVRHSNPNDLIFVINKVEENGKTYLFCLFPEFSGWMVWKDWLELYEVKRERCSR